MIQVHQAEIDPDYIGTEWRRWCEFWFQHHILVRESTARAVGNSAAADCVFLPTISGAGAAFFAAQIYFCRVKIIMKPYFVYQQLIPFQMQNSTFFT
jgi:hypothetical protein